MIALADAVVWIAYVGLGVSAAIALGRIVTGPTLADRIIALDLALVVLMVGIAVDGIDRDDDTWLNLLVVIAIIGFTATVAATQFIERDATARSLERDGHPKHVTVVRGSRSDDAGADGDAGDGDGGAS